MIDQLAQITQVVRIEKDDIWLGSGWGRVRVGVRAIIRNRDLRLVRRAPSLWRDSSSICRKRASIAASAFMCETNARYPSFVLWRERRLARSFTSLMARFARSAFLPNC